MTGPCKARLSRVNPRKAAQSGADCGGAVRYPVAMNHVLLIDDDVELVGMFAEYLEQEGFLVTCMHNGEAGARAALAGQYAIAILDVMMPGAGGIEALRQIRAGSRMPVLMLTARGDDADRILGLELGADDYVAKPCTPRELTAREIGRAHV